MDGSIGTTERVAVIGLGYVGLPVALHFARRFPTVGYDIKADKVRSLRAGVDPTGEVPSHELKASTLRVTADLAELRDATFFVIAVPTPVDVDNKPDLSPVLAASELVGKVLKRGDVVVYESTVYPGVTEDLCGPLLAQVSGLTQHVDFKLGYSPERINPGDRTHTLERVTKVVSGEDAETLERYITEAERTEGGWAVLVFHRICADSCSSTAFTPANFTALVEWLARREGRGTVVRTMRQMMGAGTAMDRAIPPPKVRPGPNLVMNPSLEAATKGSINPDCFLLADTGHELASWTRVSPGHDGDSAVQLHAGDPLVSNRRMKMLQDDGECAPAVEPGGQYEFSVWYQSDVPLRFNAFLKNDQSFWGPWALSPSIPASPGQWTKATWRIPAVPDAGRAMTVSVRLQEGQDGSMLLDEFSLVRVP